VVAILTTNVSGKEIIWHTSLFVPAGEEVWMIRACFTIVAVAKRGAETWGFRESPVM
jgi:hypothetical protein